MEVERMVMLGLEGGLWDLLKERYNMLKEPREVRRVEGKELRKVTRKGKKRIIFLLLKLDD